jgi:hypothetical protein
MLLETVQLMIVAASAVILDADGSLPPLIGLHVVAQIRIKPVDGELVRLRHSEVLLAANARYISISRRTNPVLPAEVGSEDLEF